MEANKVRQTFLDFFKSKGHEIVPSAPMVVKGDPTLMFNNSGMAPFKDIFLGNAPIKHPRIADTQKCLRVSGKHNDLEEVGVDTYHHTMFEMLGNWSFGDYFKKEAIEWAWELLTKVYKIDPYRLYVTVFEGDEKEGLAFDQEAYDTWAKLIPKDRILKGNKKDNFWEMGDMGPCGPCSEIHCDIRKSEDRLGSPGDVLVNTGHPQVIEIWNNVFMEFERKADGSLVKLPKQHVDTGMGFERLCVVLQGKQSNYDTDVFMPIINKIEELSGLRYKPEDEEHHKKQLMINIAMRVIADHIRAISFSISDGQLPSNTGAGYVIRRILRRAIRYGYQSLNLKEPFMHRLVPTLANQMGQAFPELVNQKVLIEKVIKEEEISFYKTLEFGLKRIDQVCIDLTNSKKGKVIDGKVVFELYDTFGFPLDLTQLIAKSYDLSVDEAGFAKYLEEQKNRSRAATSVDTEDWIYTEFGKSVQGEKETEFIGYDELESECKIVRYRKVKAKNKEQYNVVLSKTPFYAESGGQVGDIGVLESINEKVFITDTKKENGVTIHYCDKLPENINTEFVAKVDKAKRLYTTNNHSATHLLHAALRTILGTHVEQKGSLVNDEHLRFDFSHFSKVTDEELKEIEHIVNTKIRENIPVKIELMNIEAAKKTGAMALFGEKYGDVVRVVTIDKNFSIELCGGTHVTSTGQIGFFKLVSEGAVAAGIRRIEAISSAKVEEFFENQATTLNEIKNMFKGSKNIVKSVSDFIEEHNQLQKQYMELIRERAKVVKENLKKDIEKTPVNNGIRLLSTKIDFNHLDEIKNIHFQLTKEHTDLVLVTGYELDGAAGLTGSTSNELVKDKNIDMGKIIRESAAVMKGNGGGQKFFAQGKGPELSSLDNAINKAKTLLQ